MINEDAKTKQDLIDLICLVYHEARNVRHPVRNKLIAREPYKKLIDGLPSHRDEAWQKMLKIRQNAYRGRNLSETIKILSNQYELTLEDLRELFSKPFWKHSRLGGNKWADICIRLIKVTQDFDFSDNAKKQELIKELFMMEHNTGTVQQKLHKLRQLQNS